MLLLCVNNRIAGYIGAHDARLREPFGQIHRKVAPATADIENGTRRRRKTVEGRERSAIAAQEPPHPAELCEAIPIFI